MLELAFTNLLVVLIAGAIGLVVVGLKIKRLALHGLVGEFRRASVEEFPWVNLEKLRQYFGYQS